MYKKVALAGCIQSGHSCFAPTRNITQSPNVYVNGKKVVRVGDRYVDHRCSDNTHTPIQGKGSPTVYVNGMPLARIGDGVACGGRIMKGSSSNVFVDGGN